MNEYLLIYDLAGPDRNYSELEEAIEKFFPGSWHEFGSVWGIRTKLSAKAVRKRLMLYLDRNDRVFVVKLDADYSGYGYDNKFGAWRNQGGKDDRRPA